MQPGRGSRELSLKNPLPGTPRLPSHHKDWSDWQGARGRGPAVATGLPSGDHEEAWGAGRGPSASVATMDAA